MKKIFLALAIFSILAISCFAQDEEFDIAQSYEWLANQTVEKLSQLNTVELSFAALALATRPEYESVVKDVLYKLNEKRSLTEACWPAGKCKTYDTALATLAFLTTGQDIGEHLNWLGSAEIVATEVNPQDWEIQFITSQNGTCKIECGNKSTNEFDVSVGSKTASQLSSKCGNPTKKKTISYFVDCSNVGDENMHITLIYRVHGTVYEEIFLLRDEKGRQATLTLNNVCFPEKKGRKSCHYDATLWSSLVYKLANEDVPTLPYLKAKLPDKTEDIALLYLILGTSAEAYADWLLSHQSSSGSWGDDVVKTSLAALALSQSGEFADAYQNATHWLELRRDKKDYSWNHKIIDTALAILAFNQELPSTTIALAQAPSTETDCTNNIDDDNDGKIDCEDDDCKDTPACSPGGGKCTIDADCTSYGEFYRCENGECVLIPCDERGDQAECTSDVDCGANEYCDTEDCICVPETPEISYETYCDDGIDDDGDGLVDCDDDDCADDPACQRAGLGWIWILIVLILLGGAGGGIFYLAKIGKLKDLGSLFSGMFKKKPKKPSFEEYVAAKEKARLQAMQAQPPTTPARPSLPPALPKAKPTAKPKKEKVEEELEKSLEEARKLLGK